MSKKAMSRFLESLAEALRNDMTGMMMTRMSQMDQLVFRGQLQQEQLVKDSWAYRLRLAEVKRIRRISTKLAAIGGLVGLLSSVIGIYFDILDKLLTPIVIGIGTATFFWLLVGYGDHALRKIRVKKGWYGSDAMEAYELIQFVKKTAEDDSDDGSPPRRFFEDDELTKGAKVSDKTPVPDGLGVR